MPFPLLFRPLGGDGEVVMVPAGIEEPTYFFKRNHLGFFVRVHGLLSPLLEARVFLAAAYPVAGPERLVAGSHHG